MLPNLRITLTLDYLYMNYPNLVELPLIFAMNEVRTVETQQNEGLKCVYPKTKASISCIPIETTHLSMPLGKKTRFLPQMKFFQ